jgi:hypothetical protein
LDLRDRLGHRRTGKMDDCLVQVLDELNRFFYRAADHDPKSEVDFKRECHRALPRPRLR